MKIKGLLLKDVYELWAQSKVLLILIAVYLLVPALTGGNAMLGSVALLLLAMLPASALGYDERCKWERYARAMPVRRRDLVVSKFLLGAIAVACGAAVQALAAFFTGHTELLAMLPVTALTALVYLALSLPLLFKFGLEKGRIFFLLLTAAFVVFGGVLLGWLGLSARGTERLTGQRAAHRRGSVSAWKIFLNF